MSPGFSLNRSWQIWNTRLDDAFASVSHIELSLPYLTRLLVHNAPRFTADMLETLRLTPIRYLALSKTAVTLLDLGCLLEPETNLAKLEIVYYRPLQGDEVFSAYQRASYVVEAAQSLSAIARMEIVK